MTLAIVVVLPVSALAAAHKRVIPLPRIHSVTRVMTFKHKKWLVLRSLTISHLGHVRPYVECNGCLRERGPIHATKLKRGTITYSGVNWLLRGKYAAFVLVYRKGTIGRILGLRARLGKRPALVFEAAACLRSRKKVIKCPKHTAAPKSGTPVATSPSSATAAQPIGTPAISAAASGNAITFTGSVNGNGSAIAVTVTDTTDGASHACGTGSGVVQCSWVESGLKYKDTYTYVMTATDASGSGRAAVSAQTSATTASPPGITGASISGSVSGTSIDVTASVNDGGLAANVVLKDTTDGSTGSCTTSGDSVSCTLDEGDLSYSTTYNYTLTATDASGYGRASESASWSGTTTAAPPPPPSVTVVNGPATSTTSYCSGASPCDRIEATTANFSGTVTCHITQSTYGLSGFTSWTQGANATGYGENYQEGGTVTISCTDGTHTASGSGSM